MALTYTWRISAMQRHPTTGGVAKMEWRCLAQDGKYIAERYGEVIMEPNADDPNFIPFEQLTQEQCLAWAREAIAEQGKNMPMPITPEFIEADLARDIETRKNPPLRGGLPW